MHIVCLDLEGVLVPEVWICVAERTGIDELRLTTRDISDYDELMQHRLGVLDKHGITLTAIQDVIDTMEPLEGALDFLTTLKETHQVVIVSDTFYEFADPLMRKLERPTLLCHRLEIDEQDRVVGYRLRQPDPKRHVVEAFQSLRFQIIAAGDSYNDTSMLSAAHAGILFRAPPNVVAEFPQFPRVETHPELLEAVREASARLAKQT
jgi:phosphoserine/homoserine phosphotransferase